MGLIRKIRFVDEHGRVIAERKEIADSAVSNKIRDIKTHYSDQSAGIREARPEDYKHIEYEMSTEEKEAYKKQQAKQRPLQRRPQMPQGGGQGNGNVYYVGGGRPPTPEEIKERKKKIRQMQYQAEVNQQDHSVLGGLLHSP